MIENVVYLIVFLFILAFLMPLFQFHKYNQSYNVSSTNLDDSSDSTDSSLYPYRSKYILTNNEYRFYLSLKSMLDAKGFIICPKVGLKDLFDVTVSSKERMSYWAKISQKHIDFLICDEKLHPLCAIELDDKSHLTEEAKKNDTFKNELFSSTHIPLYRIPSTSHYTEFFIQSYIPLFTSEPISQ